MPRRSVFVSHASADRLIAESLAARLEEEGVSCWIAPRDVLAGERYAEGILRGLEECELFLVVFSEQANLSPHVSNEIEDAASKDKRILLVRTDQADPGSNRNISFFLRSHQWFDASEGPLDQHLPRLVADVHRLLESVRLEKPADNEIRDLIKAKDYGALALQSPTLALPSTPQPVIPQNRSIGVDVGPRHIRVYPVDLDASEMPAQRMSKYSEPVQAPNARAILEQVKNLIQRVLDEQFAHVAPVGIGVAVPGQIEMRSGTLKFGPSLFGARNVPFKTFLASSFPGIRVRIDNEVRCATRSELHFGVGRDFDSFCCIFVGHGLGSGLVIDRRVLFGHNFCAGEIGHTKIAPTGPPCSCGQTGCLESFVKTDAIIAKAHAKSIDFRSRELETLLETDEGALTSQRILDAVEQGDVAAREVVAEVGTNLGLGIANYLNLVNPAAVVIGGEIMDGFFFHMIDEISDAVRRNSLAEVANTPIVQCAHSRDDVAIGAGLVFHEHDWWPFESARQTASAAELN